MTRTLVIGGNRFVGNKLVKSLLSQSYVTVFNRSGTGPTGTIKIKGDRDNIEDLDRIPFEIFDYVIDMFVYFAHIKKQLTAKYCRCPILS